MSKTYTLKLKTASTTNYSLYDGTTLVTDANLTTLFATAGEAFFTIDLNSLTPTNLTSLTIVNSSDTAVMTNTGLTLVDGKNFKGEWGASATTFTSFTQLSAYGLDESQLTQLVGKIAEGKIKELEFTGHLNMWDSTLYPDGIYHLVNKTSSGGNRSVYLSNFSNGKSINVQNGDATYVVLLTNDTYHYRLLVGVNNRGNDSDRPLGMITALYATNSTSATKIFDGETVDNLTYDNGDFRKPLSARQGKVLNDKIGGDLSNLDTTTKTSLIAAINEIVGDIGDVESALNLINNGGVES